MFTTRYPLLVRIMSTRFLPMSWTSPFTVANRIDPRSVESAFSINGSSSATAVFITSADCSTNGSCISPLPNNSPTVFMPSSNKSLMIVNGAIPLWRASAKSPSSPCFSPSIMRLFNRSGSGSAASSAARLWRVLDTSTPSKSSRNFANGS